MIFKDLIIVTVVVADIGNA